MNGEKVLSEYQKAIFNEIKHGKGHLFIEAFAGSGKTFSIIESLKHVPDGKSILLCAFGRRNMLDLKEKAPSYNNLQINTLHSLGFSAIRDAWGKHIRPDPHKTSRLILALLAKDKKKETDRDNFPAMFEMKRAISLCRSYVVDTPSKIDSLLYEFDIHTFGYSRDEFIKRMIIVMSQSKSIRTSIDYDEMIYLPFAYNLPVGKWDVVYIDELQDISLTQAFMIQSACKSGGRIIMAGDRFQAIFAWRGADVDLIDLPNKLKAKTLQLPISYRCAKSIVYEAQKYVPGIKAAPNAIDGKVSHIKEHRLIETIRPGDFLLSRTNAPLVKWCMRLLRANIPASIRSEDVGDGLVHIINQSLKRTTKSFLPWLDEWKNKEVEQLKERNKDFSVITDKYDCLVDLCEGMTSIDEVKANIKHLFSMEEDTNTVALISIHGAKGLERERVFLLESSFNPKYADLQSERNIRYVAITRAKRELYFVS